MGQTDKRPHCSVFNTWTIPTFWSSETHKTELEGDGTMTYIFPGPELGVDMENQEGGPLCTSGLWHGYRHRPPPVPAQHLSPPSRVSLTAPTSTGPQGPGCQWQVSSLHEEHSRSISCTVTGSVVVPGAPGPATL